MDFSISFDYLYLKAYFKRIYGWNLPEYTNIQVCQKLHVFFKAPFKK